MSTTTNSDPTKNATVTPAVPPLTPPPGAVDPPSHSSPGVTGIVRRWKRDDILKRGTIVLRALVLLFSLLTLIIMASNKHGGWMNFDRYEEYRYVLTVSILSTLYAGFQAIRQVQELSTGAQFFQQRSLAFIDFFGDQIVAYLLISAASTGVPLTNRMRENNDNIFTDSSAAAISMQFLVFIALAFSAMISGYKLSNQSYI